MIERLDEYRASIDGQVMRITDSLEIIQKINEIIDYLNSKESINYE